ncbi:MAG: lamin tail domain-containing protein, partial [Tannerella sp.]|nr:lamin tail domain-containing protein [Tannerella sp.]
MKKIFTILLLSMMITATTAASDTDLSAPGDILLNEVMANPVGLTMLPATEYVEIFNASDQTISLRDWMFVYDGKDTPLPDTSLLSGAYAVLFRSGREISVATGALVLGSDKFP